RVPTQLLSQTAGLLHAELLQHMPCPWVPDIVPRIKYVWAEMTRQGAFPFTIHQSGGMRNFLGSGRNRVDNHANRSIALGSRDRKRPHVYHLRVSLVSSYLGRAS